MANAPKHLWLALVGLGLALGCRPQLAPIGAGKKYARALEDGDYRAAYAALHPRLQAQLTEAEFARRQDELRPFASSYAARALDALDEPEPALEITANCGEGLVLRYEEGEWRVAPETLEVFSQASPLEAVRTLVKAFRGGRRDILERLRPKGAKSLPPSLPPTEPADLAAWGSAVDQLVLALEEPEFEVLGPRARMSYGAGKSIELVLEGDQWKIEDFDP